MPAIRLIQFLILTLVATVGVAEPIAAAEPIVAPKTEPLFIGGEEAQNAWQSLLVAILDNRAVDIQQSGLAVLAHGDAQSCFVLSHLGFLFEDYAQEPALLLDELGTLSPSQDASCQAEREELMMRLASRSLQVERCELLAQKLGYIRQWALLGDINAAGRADLEKMWGVENNPDAKGLTVAGINRQWFYPSSSADGWVNLRNIFTPNDGLVYALCYIQIPIPQDIVFTWELEGSGMLFLDGQVLLRVDPAKGQYDRICTAEVTLTAGYHRLMAKSIPLPLWFARQGYDWGFRLKLTTADNHAVDGLVISTDLGCEKNITALKSSVILPNPIQARQNVAGTEFDTMIEGLTALAKGNLVAATELLQDLNQTQNRSAISSWLYAQSMLSHAEPTMRVQAASELSFARDETTGREGIRRLKNWLYLENQDYDKVLDDLANGGFATPDFYTLLGIAENKRGLAVQAENHLRQAASIGDGMATLELARLLLAQDRQSEAAQLINQAISANLNLRTQMTDLYDTWIGIMPEAANQTLVKCCRLAPYDLAMREALLESSLAASTLPYALAQARDMIGIHPYAENGYRRLAELSIFTHEQDAGREAALELAHLRPGNDWAEQYLEGTSSSTSPTIIDFAREETLAAKTLPDPDSKVLFLLDETNYYVRDDYSFDELIKRALRLETDDVRDQYGEIALPDGAELLAATVITPDGERHNASIISDPSGSATISFRGLETGCIIEFAWLTHYAKRRINNLPCFYFFAHGFASTSYRLLHARVVVDAPRQFPVHSLVARFPGTFSVKSNDGRITSTWELREIPRIVPESDMPSAFYIGPVAQGSSLSSLSVINEWLWGEIAPSLLPDEHVTKRALDVAGNAQSLEEKIGLVFRYVDRNVERINGVILNPVPARQTLINHWGRGIDRAVLLLAMLRAVGVECYPALVNSSPDLPGEEAHPTLAYYDYALVYIPNPRGREMWLDPNIQRIGLGLLLEGILDKETTIFMGNTYMRKKTPHENKEPALTNIVCNLTLSPEGWADGEGTITWSGLDALARSSFTDPHTRENDAQSIVQSYLQEATVSTVSLDDLEEPDKPLQCNFHITIPHLALTSVNGLEVMSGVIKQNLCSQFITLPRRKYPMIIDRSFYQKNSYEILLPEGAVVSPPYGSKQLSGFFGEYKLEWNLTGDKLKVQRKVEIRPHIVSPSAYPGFAEFCRSVDQTDATPIEIKLE